MQTLSANVNSLVPGVAFDDIYLDERGNIAMSYGIDAVLQACAQAAQTVLGEIIFNVDQGIPFFQTIWNGVPQTDQYTGALRSAFLSIPNVLEIVSLFAEQVNNEFQYSAVIRTTFGTGGISG